MPTPRAEVIIFPDLKRVAKERRAERERQVQEAHAQRVAASRARANRNKPDLIIQLFDANGNEVKP